MNETAATNGTAPQRLHAARCCSVTPPVLHWDEQIEAIVCTQCERIYAPIVLDALQVDRDAVIRAIVMGNGIKLRAAAQLGINRHAMRRRVVKHQVNFADDGLVVTYASQGPKAREMIDLTSTNYPRQNSDD